MEIRLLSCPLCLKPHFDGVDALRSSLITIATSQISCPVCNELLMGLDKLTIHLFSHITNNILHENLNKPPVYVETENCHSNNSKVDLQPIPISEIHQPIDQQLAASATQKIEDSPLAGGDEEKACMKCDICNFSFTDENILEIHQKLLHQTKADKKTGTYSYHCHLCSKKFKMRGSLMVHLRVAHYGFGHIDACANNAKKGTCNDGGGLGSNGNQIEEFKSTKCQDNKQWECDICSKLFTTKYFLKKHKRLHTGEMPYFCAQCNKSFTFQQSYHKHMLYHTSEKPHVCNECGRAFKELSTLHNHERIHSGERPFACETCGKCFRQRVSYLVHRRIHTGAMPYKCTACDKSFRYKVSQKSHKCPVNPPGLVVRAPDLVEKLIQNNSQKVSDKSNVQNKERGSNEKSNKAQNEAGTIPAEKQMETDEISKVESRKSTCNPPQATVTSNDIPNFAGNINTIIFNSDGQIIGQNFAYNGLNLLPVSQSCSPNVGDRHCFPDTNRNRKDSNDAYLVNVNILAENDAKVIKSPDVLLSDEEDPDFFSMVLSPVLPDVQSLCLSNGSSNDGNDTTVKEALETINEESFKKLLYGPMD